MKNTELFDLLGKIDDRFYDEALGGDSERPTEIVIKKPPFSLKRIAIPAAACLAAAVGIGVTAHYLNKADFTKVPNPTTSTVSEPNVTLVNPEITADDIAECKAQLKDRFPNIYEYPDLITGVPNFDERGTRIRIIDIDFDGCDEVLVNPNDKNRSLFIFEKTADGMIETAQIDEYNKLELDILHKYDSNGEQYWYYYDYQIHELTNGEWLQADTTARIKFENGEYSIDHPLAYGYSYADRNNTDPKQWFFKTDCAALSKLAEVPGSNISPDEFKAKWIAHTELPNFNYYTTFDEEYPPLSEIEIPVVESSHLSAENYPQNATLSVIDLGEYKLYLTASGVFRFADSQNSKGFWASSLGLDLVKDDKSVSGDGVSFFSAVKSGFANYYLYYPDIAPRYLKLYQLDDCYVAVFGYVNNEEFGWESNFFGIKDGVVTKLFSTDGNGWFVNAPLELAVSGNSLIDIDNSIEYSFNPDAFTGNPYETPHFTTKQFTSDDEFPPYNGSAALKATLSEKKVDKYTVSLLGYGLKTTDKGIEYSRLEIAVSEGSKRVFFTLPFVGGSLETQRLDKYLVPFEMKDGVGFGVFVPRGGEWEFKYLQLYEINSDLSPSNISMQYDTIVSGSPAPICGDITVIPAENKLVGVSEEYGTTTIEINFAEDWYTSQY